MLPGAPAKQPDRPQDVKSFENAAVQSNLAAQFRCSMRMLVSTVTIISANHGGSRGGLTATAVCSLSADPPSLLVCINRNSHTHDYVVQGGFFCVNLLAEEQQAVAEVFAGRTGAEGEAKFSTGEWVSAEGVAPRLVGALASIGCRVQRTVDVDTHSLVIGRPESFHFDSQKRPLVYANKGFHQIPTLGAWH
jgi:flavin reductase (DIM6/NTAB) family NADH-FMN oxidoreductase RutF